MEKSEVHQLYLEPSLILQNLLFSKKELGSSVVYSLLLVHPGEKLFTSLSETS